jgi:hypothetical protein
MWTCAQCGESHEESFDTCWKCGTGRDGTPQPDPATFHADALVLQEQVVERTILCAKCGAVMQAGFLHSPDVRMLGGFLNPDPIRWRNRRADEYPSSLPSVTDLNLPVSAYRCGECGYLEFYAHEG